MIHAKKQNDRGNKNRETVSTCNQIDEINNILFE